MFSKTEAQKFKPTNKQEFDRIVSLYPDTFFGVTSYFDGCYFTNATYYGDLRSNLFYGLPENINSSCEELNFNAFEEKQMFDMKKEVWAVRFNNKEEREAAVSWIKSFGYTPDVDNFETVCAGSFSNYSGIIGEASDILFYWGSQPMQLRPCWWEGMAKEVKLTFKTETTVVNVEYPETLTEKEMETKKIREEMEKLAERLKKLES